MKIQEIDALLDAADHAVLVSADGERYITGYRTELGKVEICTTQRNGGYHVFREEDVVSYKDGILECKEFSIEFLMCVDPIQHKALREAAEALLGNRYDHPEEGVVGVHESALAKLNEALGDGHR